jgi:hypothetical protein
VAGEFAGLFKKKIKERKKPGRAPFFESASTGGTDRGFKD